MNKLLHNVAKDLKALAKSIEAMVDGTIKDEAKKEITLEEVRAVLAEKSHAGFTAEVRGLLEKHGASKLSEIDPAKYTSLLKDAEGLK